VVQAINIRRNPPRAAQIRFDFLEIVTHARTQQNVGEPVFSEVHQMALAHMEVARQLFFRDPFLALRCGFAVHTHACCVNRMLDFHLTSA